MQHTRPEGGGYPTFITDSHRQCWYRTLTFSRGGTCVFFFLSSLILQGWVLGTCSCRSSLTYSSSYSSTRSFERPSCQATPFQIVTVIIMVTTVRLFALLQSPLCILISCAKYPGNSFACSSGSHWPYMLQFLAAFVDLSSWPPS